MFFFLSCNKEKHSSKLLMKGEVWKITSINIDGVEIDLYSTWTVSQNVDIYQGVPEIIWKKDELNSAIFEWQFHEKANKFQLNYKQLCEEGEGEMLDEMDFLTYDLSGEYDVIKRRRKEMIFKSINTLGYPKKEVLITIYKK